MWILIDSVNTCTCVTIWPHWTSRIVCSVSTRPPRDLCMRVGLRKCSRSNAAWWFSEFPCCACFWTEEVHFSVTVTSRPSCDCVKGTTRFLSDIKTVLSSNLASSDAGGIKCCWVQSQTRTRRFTWTRRLAAEARDSSLSPALTVSDAPARRFPRNTRRLLLSISNSLFVSRRLV